MPDWFDKLTIGDLLNQAAERYGPREALMYEGRRWSFADFREDVDRVARALINLGIQPGDKVSLWMPNRAEWLFLFGAVAKIGAILVPINTRFRTGRHGIPGQSLGFRRVDPHGPIRPGQIPGHAQGSRPRSRFRRRRQPASVRLPRHCAT